MPGNTALRRLLDICTKHAEAVATETTDRRIRITETRVNGDWFDIGFTSGGADCTASVPVLYASKKGRVRLAMEIAESLRG